MFQLYINLLNKLNIINYCDLFIGNSSSGIYEVPLFKKFTLNLGNRQKGRECGNSIINSDYNNDFVVENIPNTHMEIRYNLIKKGIDVNDRANDGRTALFGAVIGIINYQKNTKTLEVLLKAGGDPNIQIEEEGTSPLYFAVEKSFEAVKMLLKHKANPNIETSPLDILGNYSFNCYCCSWTKFERDRITKKHLLNIKS